MKTKKAEVSNAIIIQIILIALIMAMFIFSTAGKINGRGVRQDVIESQLAMFIEAAEPGMKFEIPKINSDGYIDSIKIEKNKLFVSLDGFNSADGKDFFSAHDVKIENEANKFVVIIS